VSDFAAAAMMRLIALGLKRQGLAPPAAPAPLRGARVPLVDKRRLMNALLQQHGAEAVLRIGEGVHDARDEPVLVALRLARDPADLVARWQRLERFIHSRHRVRVEAEGPGRLQLRHVSLVTDQPPTPAEDLLVLGLLAALIDRQGTVDLQIRVGPTGWVRREGGRWRLHGKAADAGAWQLRWALQPGVAPAPLPPAAGDWLDAAARRLQCDIARPWSLAALAAELGGAPRSLQRHLAQQGSSFVALLRQLRLAQAARLLAETPTAPAEIGYLCGFADQAHFTREFKRHCALTPLRYREQFAARG
jgi:AraC-like DNA-binding protein